MVTLIDRKAGVVFLIAGFVCLTSIILSLYSISTAHWSSVGLYNVGLFQTCTHSHCVKNQYGNTNNGTYSPLVFHKRFYNAGPLSIVGVIFQIIVCVVSFTSALIYLPPRPPLTCYIPALLIFIAFLFQFSTITEAAYGIHLNGRSSVVFETALVFQVVVLILTVIGGERIHQLTNVEHI